MRSAVAATVIVLAAIGFASDAASGRSAGSGSRIVSCDNVIGSSNSPGVHLGYRVVLGGGVSVPPAFLHDVALRKGRWRYWSKAGLVVHAGRRPVTVTVPSGWRRRAAIFWGNDVVAWGHGLAAVSTLQITACPPSPNAWNAYAGGIFMRSSSACVPLTFRIAARSQTVWFGIGRHCGGRTRAALSA
jgi:hypothetical protein